MLRLSPSSGRLEPQPGALDDAALERAPRSFALYARGLEPIVTADHFTHPWRLGEEFGLGPVRLDAPARHVARVVPPAWCTAGAG